jgi:hypothetical protein
MTTIPVSMPEVMKDMTINVEVTGQHRARARIYAGVWLMRFAARVIGVGASCIVVDLTPPESRADAA